MSDTTIPQEIARRVFTKGIDRKAAEAQSTITGDRAPGFHVFDMISVIG